MSLAEILLILVVVLLVMGPERLPELARMLGKGMREIQRASNMFRDSFMLEEQQTAGRRPDQMMPTTGPDNRDDATDQQESLSDLAAGLDEFESVRLVRMDAPATTDGTTLSIAELNARSAPHRDANVRRVELDPPIPSSIW